eukprot:3559066-Pyramimonas_sp.AAC.1
MGSFGSPVPWPWDPRARWPCPRVSGFRGPRMAPGYCNPRASRSMWVFGPIGSQSQKRYSDIRCVN